MLHIAGICAPNSFPAILIACFTYSLPQCARRYGVEVWGYCLTGNHDHLIAVRHSRPAGYCARCKRGIKSGDSKNDEDLTESNNGWNQWNGDIGVLGARNGAMFWQLGGKFWISGGYGGSHVAGQGRYNDLWSYTPADNSWRFVHGPEGETAGSSPLPAIGTVGMPDGRMNGVCWTSGNTLAFFGGTTDTTLTVRSDFWSYNVTPHSTVADWQLF